VDVDARADDVVSVDVDRAAQATDSATAERVSRCASTRGLETMNAISPRVSHVT
jgi:hypothetical protein